MDADDLRWILTWTLLATAALWFVSSWFFRVQGQWDRVLSPEEQRRGDKHERIRLQQWGPWVSGQRDAVGGVQHFSGFMVGRTLYLRRRDTGEGLLRAQGFPPALVPRLQNLVMARLELRLEEGGQALEGAFVPYRIEFSRQPLQLTGSFALPPERRRYERMQRLALREVTTALKEEDDASGSLVPPAGADPSTCRTANCHTAICRTAICRTAICRTAICRTAICRTAICRTATACRIPGTHS